MKPLGFAIALLLSLTASGWAECKSGKNSPENPSAILLMASSGTIMLRQFRARRRRTSQE